MIPFTCLYGLGLVVSPGFGDKLGIAPRTLDLVPLLDALAALETSATVRTRKGIEQHGDFSLGGGAQESLTHISVSAIVTTSEFRRASQRIVNPDQPTVQQIPSYDR